MNDYDINLRIIGGKPQKEVVDYVKENNMANIEFINNLSKDELNKCYSNSDMFVLCCDIYFSRFLQVTSEYELHLQL